jgi:hypothetical protein
VHLPLLIIICTHDVTRFFTTLITHVGKTICLVVVSKVINLLTGKRQGWVTDGPPKIQCTSPRKYCL